MKILETVNLCDNFPYILDYEIESTNDFCHCNEILNVNHTHSMMVALLLEVALIHTRYHDYTAILGPCLGRI
jgi:hypothetical protein